MPKSRRRRWISWLKKTKALSTYPSKCNPLNATETTLQWFSHPLPPAKSCIVDMQKNVIDAAWFRRNAPCFCKHFSLKRRFNSHFTLREREQGKREPCVRVPSQLWVRLRVNEMSQSFPLT
uniref:Uncharacterized protein n=1 Tax=Rousettus aegyptiacus TaxID=9407 RepID=A0A7J8BSQ4_ROUAE|nr:hypothetical protein HJG63_009541 [Rousettus aegyptiacus]